MIAGVVVAGLGGRLVMVIIALLNRSAFGRLTEAGEVIGEFTIEGTLALLLFGGLGAGITAGVLWVVIGPWVPWSGVRRWLLAMPIAVALGTFILVESTNFDFRIVGPTWLVLALLLGLVALTGAATAWLDERLERRLPRVDGDPTRSLLLYGVVAVLGTPGLLLTVGAFFNEEYATGPMPRGVGPALLVVGAATIIFWTRRIATGRETASRLLVIAGRSGIGAAVLLGALHLAEEIDRIYATV